MGSKVKESCTIFYNRITAIKFPSVGLHVPGQVSWWLICFKGHVLDDRSSKTSGICSSSSYVKYCRTAKQTIFANRASVIGSFAFFAVSSFVCVKMSENIIFVLIESILKVVKALHCTNQVVQQLHNWRTRFLLSCVNDLFYSEQISKNLGLHTESYKSLYSYLFESVFYCFNNKENE